MYFHGKSRRSLQNPFLFFAYLFSFLVFFIVDYDIEYKSLGVSSKNIFKLYLKYQSKRMHAIFWRVIYSVFCAINIYEFGPCYLINDEGCQGV